MPNVKSYVLGGAVTLGFFRGFCGARCEVVGSKIKSGFFSMVMVVFSLHCLAVVDRIVSILTMSTSTSAMLLCEMSALTMAHAAHSGEVEGREMG